VAECRPTPSESRIKRDPCRDDPAGVVLVDELAAICSPPPNVKPTRLWIGDLPSTSPGIRKTRFFPLSVPSGQNVAFIPISGQTRFPAWYWSVAFQTRG